jgi:hypothetical protein
MNILTSSDILGVGFDFRADISFAVMSTPMVFEFDRSTNCGP